MRRLCSSCVYRKVNQLLKCFKVQPALNLHQHLFGAGWKGPCVQQLAPSSDREIDSATSADRLETDLIFPGNLSHPSIWTAVVCVEPAHCTGAHEDNRSPLSLICLEKHPNRRRLQQDARLCWEALSHLNEGG